MNGLRIKDKPAGLILTPGAGANADHATLVALDNGIVELAVQRLTLGTTSVKSAIKKITQAGEILAEQLDVDPKRIAYGGRSFGGRACSVAVADGLSACALVLLSYPLHPPAKPDNLRTEHFDRINVPVLFVSGDKDPFGSKSEFEKHTQRIGAAFETRWLKGNHSPKGQDDELLNYVRYFLKLTD